MNPKQERVFKIITNFLESRNISQDTSSLENRIIFWDNKKPHITILQLAALALVNPPANIYFSDSDIREISDTIFHSPNYLNS